MPDTTPLIDALVARLLENGVLDADDCAIIADMLEGEGHDELAHVARCWPIEHAASKLTMAEVRRATLKIVTPKT